MSLSARVSTIAAPAIVPSILSAGLSVGQCGACASTPVIAPPSLEPHAISSEQLHTISRPANPQIPSRSAIFASYPKKVRLLPYAGDRWQNPPTFHHVRPAHHHLHQDRRGPSARHLFAFADRASVHQALGHQGRDARH